MQLSGMTPNPFNKPAKASKPAPKAPAKSGGKHPHSNLGKYLHPKKGR